MPAPPQLVPLFRFSRLSASSYETIHRVVDADDAFRARVAEHVTDESTVGRAGWLWLHRPAGWTDDPVFAGDGTGSSSPTGVPTRAQRDLERAKERAARDRDARDQADDRRRRAEARVGELTAALAAAESERDALRADVARLTDERQDAVRTAKELEADAVALRRDLKVARRATREAEAELAALRAEAAARAEATRGGSAAPAAGGATSAGAAGGGSARSSDGAASVGPDAAEPPAVATAAAEPPVGGVDGADLALARAGVKDAAAAAVALARALDHVADALGPGGAGRDGDWNRDRRAADRDGDGRAADRDGDRRTADRADGGPGRSSGAASTGERRRAGDRRRGPGRRRPPQLPPGILDDSPEAHRHLATAAGAHVVVDGYNLARTAWPGLDPEEERRRTVGLLEELAARTGQPVTVVFDGDDAAVAPLASRSVRVVFSTTGVTADETIGDLLGVLPASQAVVVVSSDREVADDARAQGASSLSSADFLAAVGR